MSARLKIQGNHLVIFEDGDESNEYIRYVRKDVTFRFDSSDNVQFFVNVPNEGGSENPYLLGRDNNTFAGASIIDDRTSLVFTSVASLKDFLADNTGFFFDQEYINSPDYKYLVASNRVPGSVTVNKFGYNDDLDIGSEEVIASFGGVFNPATDVMTTAQTFTITYDNAVDGLGRTGALSLLISYLDSNYEYKSAIHTLSNTGSESTSFTGLGINRAVVLSNGGAGWNTSNIIFKATTDLTTQAMIPEFAGVTEQLIYHTGIGRTFLLDWLELNALKISGGGGDPEITFRLYSWSRVTQTRYTVFRHRMDTMISNTKEFTPSQPLILGGREVVYLTASTNKDNTSIDARFSGIDIPTT